MHVNGLDKTLAEVYGLNLDKLLVLELELAGPHLFGSSRAPKCRMVQVSPGADLNTAKTIPGEASFGLKWQCEQRMDRWLKQPDVWPNRIKHGQAPPQPMLAAGSADAYVDPRDARAMRTKYGLPKGVHEGHLRYCVEMGFDEMAAMCALKQSGNDVVAAAELLSGGEAATLVEFFGPHLYEDFERPRTEVIPPIDFGGFTDSFLLTSLRCFDTLVRTCNQRCIICDQPLQHAGLKPSICDRALCNFSYEQYGLGSDLATEIRYAPELIDMLISFCAASLFGANPEANFDPFPFGVRSMLSDVVSDVVVTNLCNS
eukprot:TRINITY_DN951_c0_g1_i3.p1 TRINITY_DN951_c0_g1~~TRINITY_DN951_c0_g1_i3.p1  ORF type:complete len:315 (-),score=58.56 TRINITY_DN951_c0_g1_i3:790-1734(-)